MRFLGILAVLGAMSSLAGCSEESAPLAADACAADGCAAGAPPPVWLTRCRTSSVGIQLPEEVYDLPEGYTSRPIQGAPQRVVLYLARCEAAEVGELRVADVSFGTFGVIVERPEGAPEANTHTLVLEVLTDSEPVADAFANAGYNVVQATVDTEQTTGTRRDTVTGGVDYSVESMFVPAGDGPGVVAPYVPSSDVVHTPLAWSTRERECMNYLATPYQTVTASRGALAQAVGYHQPVNSSTTYIDCTWGFEFTLRPSA